jgi:hypothetical protein
VKKLLIFIYCSCTILASGCAAPIYNYSADQIDSFKDTALIPTPDTVSGVLCIFSRDEFEGSLRTPLVYLNNEKLGELPVAHYSCVSLPSGKYELATDTSFDVSGGSSVVNVNAGEYTFIEIALVSGWNIKYVFSQVGENYALSQIIGIHEQGGSLVQ